ncbi:MAG: hypothetical protein HY367_02980 [Candidatus Aenigmarchaeota archaeon]|nr:hypothetical protein [Candidatus Aenigmarchaeota archaeon]
MRGVWYALEAILAGIIIVVFLLATRSTLIQTSSPQEISIMGYSALKSLDDQGILRDYVAANDTAGLNSRVEVFGFSHAVQICDYGNNCFGSAPSAGDVFVAAYIVSGDGAFRPAVVRLFIYK